MNVLNFKKKTHKSDLKEMVLNIKEIDTQISQLKHRKEAIIKLLTPSLDTSYSLYDYDKNLLATCVPAFRNTFQSKKLKEKYPEIHAEFVERKAIKGTWRWL